MQCACRTHHYCYSSKLHRHWSFRFFIIVTKDAMKEISRHIRCYRKNPGTTKCKPCEKGAREGGRRVPLCRHNNQLSWKRRLASGRSQITALDGTHLDWELARRCLQQPSPQIVQFGSSQHHALSPPETKDTFIFPWRLNKEYFIFPFGDKLQVTADVA